MNMKSKLPKGITQRGKRFWISYNVNGQRIRESAGESLPLAREALIKKKAEAAEGKYFPNRKNNSVTFQDIAGKFWEMHGRHLRSPSWASVLKDLREDFGHLPAVKISSVDIETYYNKIRARASVSTANRHITLLKSIFNKAIIWEMFNGENPTAGIAKLKEPAHRLRYLSQMEIGNLLGAADDRMRPLLIAALLTGMRRGELLALTWANVDLARGMIYILQSKSGKPREIPIAPKLREILAEMRPREPAAKVFDIPIITLRRSFAKALSTAGISGFHFHDLRHTFASHFIMKTGNLPALQKLLGHASPIMTQRYAHLSNGYLQTEMLAFNSCMSIKSVSEPENRVIGHNSGTIAIPAYKKYAKIYNDKCRGSSTVERSLRKRQVVGSNPILGF